MAPSGTILYHGMEISEREREFLERSIAGISKVDGSKVKEKQGQYEPSKGVKGNQTRMGRRWMLYVATHPGASVSSLSSLEEFMLGVGTATVGRKGDDYYFKQLSEEEKRQRQQAGYQTIRNSWNNFCGWCKRMNHPISVEHKEHMTQYNKQFLRIVANLRDSVRESKFASDFHYGILAVYTFRRNNTQYNKLKAMIIHWTMSSISFFGSHRIGDLAKSSAREDSEREKRGSHFKDVDMFAMFNERTGRTQLCIRFTKDEKGKEDNPQDRGQTTFYEDMTGPLYENCFMFCLVILLARTPFRDYQSSSRRQLLQKLLDIKVTKEQRFARIYWRHEFLDKPFFECSTKDSESIETASSLHRRHKDSCYRAGLPNAPNFHDFRRKGLTNADEKHSEASRMRLGGHVKAGIFRRHYQPRETIDGAANFLGREQRKDVLEVSQELNIPYIPNLLQSLPARELYDLQVSKEYREIENQIDRETCPREVGRLKRKLESLKIDRLKWLRAGQAFDDPPRYEHELYSRVRFMKPERRRLESNLFEEVEMRSETGLQVIEDLLALYLQDDKEVEFRPGLEPSRCSCGKPNDVYDWRHVLECHKKAQTEICGFSEFCFLCDEWTYEKDKWEQHCRWHVDNLETFPAWIDPLMDDGVLAVAGFCEFCLIDSRLPASDRMRQFTWRHSWQDHYERHYNDAGFIPKCRHRSFDSILELKFHLHDWHGVHMSKSKRQRNGLKRQKRESEPLIQANKRQKIAKKGCKIEGGFLNSTVDSIALGLADQRSWSEHSRTSYSSAQKLDSLRGAPDTCPNNLDTHAAGSDAISAPCYSSHDVSKAENAELESLCPDNAIRKGIPNFENDFIDIDDVFNTSPFDHTLPSILDDIKEEELETIDLTGTGDEGADGALEAFWTDSGYGSPGNSTSCSHAMIDGDGNDNNVDEKNRLTDRGVVCRAEVPGICQRDLPAIDPILLNITDDTLRHTEMTCTALNPGVPLKQPEMEMQSEDEEYNRPTDTAISHKLVETVLHHDIEATETGNTHLAPSGFGAMSNSEEEYEVEAIIGHDTVKDTSLYRVKWKGWPTSANTWEPIGNLVKCMDLIQEFHEPCGNRRRLRRPSRQAQS